MVTMKCNRCGSSFEISTVGFVTLGCRVCGNSRIELDREIERKSALDGYVEKVAGGKVVDASHNRSYLWKINELPTPKVLTQEKQKPKRKRVKRIPK